MRILVLNPHMRDGYSGPAVFMERLFGCIAEQSDHQVSVVGPVPGAEISPAIHYTSTGPPLPVAWWGQAVWVLRCSLILIRRRHRYDLVHFHGVYLFNLVLSLLLMLLKRPYVLLPLAVAGDMAVDSRANRVPFLRALRRLMVSRAVAGFALARENVDELVYWGLDQKRAHRIANPVDARLFQRERPTGSTPARRMIFIGSLGPRKRPELILEATGLLIAMGWKAVSAVFVGPFEDEAYRRVFESRVDELGVTANVKLWGYQRDVTELPDVRNGVFVLLSAKEGLPGAMAEAMALGLPVVVTDVGAMPEVVAQSGGGSVIEPDGAQLARVVGDWWSDTEKLRHLGDAAHAYARDVFTPTAVAQTYTDVLKGIEE